MSSGGGFASVQVGSQPASINEERYLALVRAVSTFVWVADALGNFTVPQPGWEEYTGHDFAQHRGNLWIQSVYPDDQARVAEVWRKAVEAKSWYEVEWRCWHGATQSWRRCVTRGVPILNPDGSVREWIGAVTDIEHRLGLEQIFEREWLRQVQTVGDFALWEWDSETNHARWTAELYLLFGAPDGTSWEELDAFIHADDRENVMAARAEAAVSGALDVTFRIVRPAGEVRWLRSKGGRVPDNDGTKVVGVLIDVTAQMELQEKLRAQANELETSNRELSFANQRLSQFQFAASHDLREPLREVALFSQLLERKLGGTLDGEVKYLLETCRKGALRIEQLLNDLLAYTKLEAAAPPITQPVDSRDALERARENLSIAIEETNAKIEAGELPSVFVEVSALVRLFQNLLSNAIKYRSASAPRILVSAERDGAFWRFTVADNGIGIEPQYHQKIFGIFARLRPRGADEGTGIGLALCQRIIERHGGRIWVESEPGEGSTFYFTLPG